eukprot:jgi/Chlat1/5677/Chrsp37S05483
MGAAAAEVRSSQISVSIRLRPLSKVEAARGGGCWDVRDSTIIACLPNGNPWPGGPRHSFDRVFSPENSTSEMYTETTRPIILSTVNGFNGTVFAYGQTSSGKTYTMRGSNQSPGVIPLAVYDAFDEIYKTQDREFLVRVSYMEIYNEEINDLLNPNSRRLQVHETIERGVFVAGLREEIVTSPEEVVDLMTRGEEHRHYGETNMNQYSSRSHTIFRMVIESRERAADEDAASIEQNGVDAVRVSTLNLVDLAGSERAAKTGADGVRMKEGAHINKSLMYLGQVIKKLSEGVDARGGHINFRDSKLTRILQSALGGNSMTAIICCISPATANMEETRSTLLFAERAKRVTNNAQVNEVLTDQALLQRQKKEIAELRRKLQAANSSEVELEVNRLRQEMLRMEQDNVLLELQLAERTAVEAQHRAKIDSLTKLVLAKHQDEANLQENWTKGGNRRHTTFAPRLPASSSHQLPDVKRPKLAELPVNILESEDTAPLIISEEPAGQATFTPRQSSVKRPFLEVPEEEVHETHKRKCSGPFSTPAAQVLKELETWKARCAELESQLAAQTKPGKSEDVLRQIEQLQMERAYMERELVDISQAAKTRIAELQRQLEESQAQTHLTADASAEMPGRFTALQAALDERNVEVLMLKSQLQDQHTFKEESRPQPRDEALLDQEIQQLREELAVALTQLNSRSPAQSSGQRTGGKDEDELTEELPGVEALFFTPKAIKGEPAKTQPGSAETVAFGEVSSHAKSEHSSKGAAEDRELAILQEALAAADEKEAEAASAITCLQRRVLEMDQAIMVQKGESEAAAAAAADTIVRILAEGEAAAQALNDELAKAHEQNARANQRCEEYEVALKALEDKLAKAEERVADIPVIMAQLQQVTRDDI